jgi:hypothetical protein
MIGEPPPFQKAAHGVAVVAARSPIIRSGFRGRTVVAARPVPEHPEDAIETLTMHYDRLLATYGGFFHLARVSSL